MLLLLTGCNGYVGPVMMQTLRAAGHEVVGVDTDFFSGCDFGGAATLDAAVRKDVRDLAVGDLSGVEAVVHLAALSNDPIGELDPRLTDEINFRASVRLAELAKAAGVRRFVFASSCSMYGATGQELVDEQDPLQPLSAYAVSKVRTEERLRELADGTFSPVLMRNATLYGVSPRHRLDLVLNNLVAWACLTGTVRVLSDGTPWRPIVHVEDMCAAFAAVLAAPVGAVHNQAFNVGSNAQNYRVIDLARIVADVVPGSRVEVAAEAGPDARSYRVDFSKLRTAVADFQPRWDARSGADQLYRAYRDNGLREEDLHGRRYVRLRQIQHLLATQQVDGSLRWKRVNR
jgi:nucleoside-diphosphate-sugar epimerase